MTTRSTLSARLELPPLAQAADLLRFQHGDAILQSLAQVVMSRFGEPVTGDGR